MSERTPTTSALWFLLTIALIPVLIALLVPMLPDLVQKLERVRFGSFEADLASDRVAAGSTTALISERSAQEFDFELEAWAGYDERFERNKFIESFFTGESKAENEFAVVYHALVGPLANVLKCQRMSGVGHPEHIVLVDRMILILSDRQTFVGVQVPSAARMSSAGSESERWRTGTAVIAEAQAATWRIDALLRLGDPAGQAPGDQQKADAWAGDPCGTVALREGLSRVSLAGSPKSSVVAFRDGHLTAFVAALIAVRGGGGEAALMRAARELRRAAATNVEVDSKLNLSPIERFNIRWGLARAMMRARWDSATIHSHLEEARLTVYCVIQKMSSTKLEDESPTNKCSSWAVVNNIDKESQKFADELKTFFRPLVLTDIVVLVNQYQLESLHVPDDLVEKARKANDALEKMVDEWTGSADVQDSKDARLDRILANATASVQIFNIMNRKDGEPLDLPTCNRAKRRMSRVLEFWAAEEGKSRDRGEIGAHQAPWMQSAKFSKYIEAACREVSD